MLEIGGVDGYRAFNFEVGTSVVEIAAAVNRVSDELGVVATLEHDLAQADSRGNVILTSVGANNDIIVTADAIGRAGGDIDIIYNPVNGAAATTARVTHNADGSKSIRVDLAATDWGTAGGIITSTAQDVVDALNSSAGDNPGGLVTATLATGNDGTALVTAFTDRAYHGTPNTGNAADANNYLQFLGPDGSSDLDFRFDTNGANQSLSIDLEPNSNPAGGNQYTAVTVNLATDIYGKSTTTAADLVDFVNAGGSGLDALGISVSHAGTSTGTGLLGVGVMEFASENITPIEGYATTTTQNAAGINAQMTITAKTLGGEFDDIDVFFQQGLNFSGQVYESISYNTRKNLMYIYIDNGVTTLQDILDTIDTPYSYVASLFSFTPLGDASGVLYVTDSGDPTSGGLTLDTSTQTGVHMLDNHDAGDPLLATSITFAATDFGSNAFVSVKSLTGTFDVVDADGVTTDRAWGTDANVQINSLQAHSDGLRVGLNQSDLHLAFTLDAAVTADSVSSFQITGDAIRYLSGISNGAQQYTSLGIGDLATDELGDHGGRLNELHSDASGLLGPNTRAAKSIVAEAIDYVEQVFVRLDVLGRGESAVSVVVADAAGGSTRIDALPEVDYSKRVGPLLAAADNGLASVGQILDEIRQITAEVADRYYAGRYYMDPREIEIRQLRLDILLQALRRAADSSTADSITPLDGRFRLAPDELSADTLHNVEINHAIFDGQNPLDVDVRIVDQADQARLIYPHFSVTEDVILEVGGPSGTEAFKFAAGSSVSEMASAINLISDWSGLTAAVQGGSYAEEDTAGSVTLTSVGPNNDIILTADTAGLYGGDIDVIYNAVSGGTIGSSVTNNLDGSKSITVDLAVSAWCSASGKDISLRGSGSIDLTANAAGSMFNDVDIMVINSPRGNSATYNHANKLITVSIDMSGGEDSSDVADMINRDLNHLFTCAVNNDAAVASGVYANVLDGGTDGGIITSTAADVICEINITAGPSAGALVTAAAAEVSTTNTVTLFTDRAYHGTPNAGADDDANNYLQFLGPDSSSDLNFRFLAGGANQRLSVDLVGNSQTAGFATGVVQSHGHDASFIVTAKTAGRGVRRCRRDVCRQFRFAIQRPVRGCLGSGE